MYYSTGSGHERGDGIVYCLIGGPLLMGWGIRKLNEKRLIENTPVSRIRSAAMGLVELSGLARPRKPQKSPLSNMDACWWNCQIQELRSNGKSSHWETIKQVGSTDLFYLEDATGRALVNPLGAEFHILNNSFDLNASTRTQIAPVLNSWGIDDMGWFGFEKRMRILEEVIPECAPLFVMGELISFIDSASPSQNNLLVKRPANGNFIVSTQSERELVSSFAWSAPAAIIGGIAISGVGVWLAILQSWNPFVIIALVAAGLAGSLFFKQIMMNLGGASLWD